MLDGDGSSYVTYYFSYSKNEYIGKRIREVFAVSSSALQQAKATQAMTESFSGLGSTKAVHLLGRNGSALRKYLTIIRRYSRVL